ncbi:MAG: 16S rRNA (adenine(1518)-N(6)/adenine(1519)-N(6))-dimethyltransferase RsmA [Bacteroidales bacterium]|nr:16S rRNA (adenine(1518)-N(6)/adenine(1519)-N(6))-dimethyltransferase RsmA [Bacteroidales bacterium]
MHQVKAKKSLGQHFLTDLNIAGKIAGSLTYNQSGSVIEVGPGTGVLTRFLLQHDVPFFAVEIDRESIEFLKKEFPEKSFIIEGDFLRTTLEKFPKPIHLIGNFPYYISSQIFFRVLENKNDISEVVCMIQKEVAERIAAPPGNKTYGILSVLLQSFYNIEYLFTVHEHCFSPAPKVKSGVIRLTRNNRKDLPCNEKLFFAVVKQSFNQRRKTLRNSLKGMLEGIDTSSDFYTKRPEQLSVNDFVALAQTIEHFENKGTTAPNIEAGQEKTSLPAAGK